MQTIEKREVAFISKIVCDRCNFEELINQPSSLEMTSIAFRAGYGSKFGDGSLVSIDLCESCLFELLGPWIRVIEDDPLAPKLSLFDPKIHGGEFPFQD